jgi:hypothetical protein
MVASSRNRADVEPSVSTAEARPFGNCHFILVFEELFFEEQGQTSLGLNEFGKRF